MSDPQELTYLIDIDNIIASYPVKTIKLHECGTFDDSREGVAVRGWTPAFTTAFPAAGDTDVKGRVEIERIGDFTIPVETTGVTRDLEVTKVTMDYRWRYLDQIVGEWQTVEMVNTDGAGVMWETKYPLDLSDGLGDIEYSFAAEITSPYYLFGDYTGCNVTSEDWIERIRGVDHFADTNTAFAKYSGNVSPAGGTDFFVRLREGASQYELVQLVSTVTGSVYAVTNQVDVDEGADPLYGWVPFTRVDTNDFEIVGDHLWRGFMETPTNHSAFVDFHFLGLNYTENGATALAGNATHWKPVDSLIAAGDLPYSGVVDATDEPQDSRIEIDAAQGYLMFEFNDQFKSFTATHADYQNFNLWTSANTNAVFIGDTTSATTGVARTKSAYTESFTNITGKTSDELSTNIYWKEDFAVRKESSIQDSWERNIPFVSKLSPNGWTCDNGEWASEHYITNGLAFRMAGCGYGAISLQNLTEPMNGVDTFTFKARISQYLAFDSFSYNKAKWDDKNYAISAGVAMSTDNGKDMSPETPTVSLVSYYNQNEGCYEFRATRYDKWVVKLEIYKWAKEGYEVKSRLLATTNITEAAFGGGNTGKTSVSNWLQNASFSSGSMQLYGMYMWVTNAAGKAVIGAGIARVKKSVSNMYHFFDYTKTDVDQNNAFFNISCVDTTNPLKRGAYGVGANDCRGLFNQICRYGMTSGFSPRDPSATYERSEFDAGNWTPAIGRAEIFNEAHTDQSYGIKAIVAPQPLHVLFAPAPEGATQINNVRWSDAMGYTVSPSSDVTDFQDTLYTVEIHSTSNYFPRLQHGASAYGPRTDIVVDNLEIKGYRGVPATTWGPESIYQWAWTETWLTKPKNSRAYECQFRPSRANPSYPLSLRSPIVNGISMLNFRYKNAKAGVKLLVQLWTEDMEHAYDDAVLMTRAVSSPKWVTMDEIEFASDSSEGTHTTYFSLRAPIQGVVRLVMEPSIVTAATNGDADAQRKEITITEITVWDEPALDEYSWIGWNMQTTESKDKAYLPDPAANPPGLSGALNNSLTKNVDDSLPKVDYAYHNPFVQSPLAEGGIGQVSFKARMYTTNQPAATVSLLGTSDPSAPDNMWKTITNIVVDSKSYKTYSWTIPGDSSSYKSIRFAVDGVAQTNSVDVYRLNPQRVLLEEIVVSEPIAPRIRFAAAMPFRSGLFDKGVAENLLAPEQQPLVGENFGFQAELKLSQLADELDEDSVEVHVKYYHGSSPWGWENWKDLPEAVEITLPAVEGTNLVYRSSYDQALSIVPPFEQTDQGTLNVVQYHMWVTYRKKGDDGSSEPNRHDITESEWTRGASGEGKYSYPEWYWPLNLNESLGGGLETEFSAYTVLDTVSPYRAWINEFNIYDGEKSSGFSEPAPSNQFVEVAVPIGADLTGWYVKATDDNNFERTLFIFGEDSVPKTKYEDATNHYAFIQVASPETLSRFPATYNCRWTTDFPEVKEAGGRFNYYGAYALELVRPSGIIEQQIVVGGTNIWAGTDFEELFSPTLLLDTMAEHSRRGYRWTYNGSDSTPGTLGAMWNYGQGGLASNGGTWEEDLMPTAGKVNRRWDGTAEDIDENWFLEANGTNVWVFATVISDHLAQKSGLYTSKAFRIVLPSGITTNITYQADDWWRIAYIKMNGEEVAAAKGQKTFDLKLSDLTENVDVVACAEPSGSLTNGTGFSTNETNKYTDAVMDWLGGFPEVNEDGTTNEIKLTWLYNPYGTIRNRQLTLTEMYWLDITPIEQCELWAGIKGNGAMRVDENDSGRSPDPDVLYHERISEEEYRAVTNIRVTVFMMITNRETHAVWSPNCLQTVDSIRSGADTDLSSWPGVTFKVEGQLREASSDRWVPLRHFVFGEGSFKARTGASDDHCARIEIWDPFDRMSPGFEAGWSPYRFTGAPLLRWNIDSARSPIPVELMKPDSTYKEE